MSLKAYFPRLIVPALLLHLLRRRSLKLIKVFEEKGAKPVVKDGKQPRQDQLIKKLTPMLKDGSKTVADLGALCDSLFDFEDI